MEYVQLRNNEDLPQLKSQRPFKCVVIIDAPVSHEWQAKVSRWLVNSGCLYMMAWGKDCSSWDDSVDYANMEYFEYQEIPPESFVVTTWHESESLSEVFEFCKLSANHEFKNIESTLLLHISKENMSEAIMQEYKIA